jgi:hypothetical protein
MHNRYFNAFGTLDRGERRRVFWKAAVTLTTALPLVFRAIDASATTTFCAVSERTDDGFVSVRQGPGVDFPALGRVVPSEQLMVAIENCRSDFGPMQCDEKGVWLFVERVYPIDSRARTPLKGWVHRRFIRQVGCADE